MRAHSKGLTAAIGRLRHAVRPVRPSLHLPRGLLPAAACRRAVFATVRRPQLRFRLVEQICADQGPDRRAAKDQTRCEACAPKLTPPPRPAARCRLPPRYFYVRQAPLMSSGASRGEQDDSRPSRRTDAEVSLTQLMCANMPSLLITINGTDIPSTGNEDDTFVSLSCARRQACSLARALSISCFQLSMILTNTITN